jgi:putative ABC transport system permease protein
LVPLAEGVRIALLALWANKLRSALTLAANVVAVTAVIAVVSILDGMDAYVRTQVADEGSGIYSIRRLDPLKILTNWDAFLESLHNPPLTLEDVEFLEQRLSLAASVVANAEGSERAERRDKSIPEVEIIGYGVDYPELRDMRLVAGRHLAALEVARSAPVTVIGWDVRQKLFPDGVDPLDKRILVAGQPLRVIGVFEARGSLLGQSQDLFVVVPISTYVKMRGTRGIRALCRVHDLRQIDDAVAEARFFMRLRHRLRPAELDDFAVTTSAAFLELWQSLSRAIFAGLVGITAISLVVGGIVIMNIMLVSVTERTREIGLRKALGATRLAILYQVLVESMTISGVGGVLGILLGFVAASLVASFSPLPYAIEGWAIAVAFVVTFLVGLFFGLYPANRAARLDPIEALRHE